MEYKNVYNGLQKSKMRYKKCKANSINMIITFGNGKTEFNKKKKIDIAETSWIPLEYFFWRKKNQL